MVPVDIYSKLFTNLVRKVVKVDGATNGGGSIMSGSIRCQGSINGTTISRAIFELPAGRPAVGIYR